MTSVYPIRRTPLCIDDPPTESVRQCIAAWRSWGCAGAMPSWSKADMLFDLPAPVLPMTLVIDVPPDRGDFVYRFWGSGFTRIHNKDYTGDSCRNLKPAAFAKIVIAAMNHVCETKQPLLYAAETITFANQSIQEYVLRLPLFRDDRTIDKVVTICWTDIGKLGEWFKQAKAHEPFAACAV